MILRRSDPLKATKDTNLMPTTVSFVSLSCKEGRHMNEQSFKFTIIAAALGFTALFAYWCIPPLIANPDIIGAFAAGFVNPYSSGYSADVLACWAILSAWIIYERRALGVRHGLWCIALGIIPGVAVGFAGYLLLRMRQLPVRLENAG
jgi:Terpene cyclase DEP1